MIDIINEPAGKVYADLINFGQKYCSSFSLVWRDQCKFNELAKTIENILNPYFLKEEYTNKWPGTELIGHKATVRFYQFDPKTIDILQKAKSLYSWLCPDRPEDLAFYSTNGKCVLGSIAHEEDSFIYLGEISLEIIKKEMSELKIKVNEIS